jgi:hypothetical protein
MIGYGMAAGIGVEVFQKKKWYRIILLPGSMLILS